LAVIDLTDAGRQPMADHEGLRHLVYNGEIYNSLELRAAVGEAGKTPASGYRGVSDTESLLASISAFGIYKSVEHLVGMFAFGLWNAETRSLTLVRDRLGIKPLYYGYVGERFVFASCLSPFKALPGPSPDIDRKALASYLRTLYVPAPYSIYSGIRKLPPGCILTISQDDIMEGNLPEPVNYWSVQHIVEQGLIDPFQGDEREAADELERLLQESVRLRMIADVPLGAFLSGGVDSSVVAACMQRASDRPVKTYTIGFSEAEYDESKHAAAVAAHLETDHTQLVVTPRQAMDVIPLLPRIYDEPFADASQIPSYLVSKLARHEVTVALSGDGGDELFCGYNRHRFGPQIWEKVRHVPMPLRKAAATMLNAGGIRAADYIFQRFRHRLEDGGPRILRDKLQKSADALACPTRESFYQALCSYNRRPEELLLQGHDAESVFSEPHKHPKLKDFSLWMAAMDQITYLPDDILAKMDRAGMAVSLEARVPLLDHRLVAFAHRLPLSMKIQEGRSKHLLRQVLYRMVPQKLIDRPKQGFGIPIDGWLRGPLREWAQELLDEKRLASEGFFQPKGVGKMWREHTSGKANRQYHLWAVLMFQAWLAEQKR
jgi:asparagine synthase (glutamine-hydrolysing)